MAKAKSKGGVTFETFEVFGKLQWYVKDEDGNVIDAWNDSLAYDAAAEKVVGGREFRTDKEAAEYFAKEHPDAVDFHTFAKEA